MTTPLLLHVPHILIVDDNPGDIELMTIATEMSGITALIDSCPDGVDAIARLESLMRGEDLPELLLLDLNMPRVTGFEVLGFMRDHQLVGRIAVVVLSTSSQSEDRNRCLAMGAREMHTKPETIQGLRQLISGLRHYLAPAPRIR